MSDTWSDAAAETSPAPRDPLRAAAMAELVERALQRELAARRELRPHVQLGVPLHATAAVVDEAYARLQRRYRPDAFAEHGEAAVAAAASIVELLGEAHRSLRATQTPVDDSAAPELRALVAQPRADETRRALDTLRAAIARRLDEAERHRQAGRVADAIRGFESVVILDRKNAIARQALRELRRPAASGARAFVARVLARIVQIVRHLSARLSAAS